MSTYINARKQYEKFGVDTDKAIDELMKIPVSLHCWQGDDVSGFENDGALSGGIQVTGNYIGKARNAEQLFKDLDFTLKHIPGKKRINLHAIYAITDSPVERDKIKPEHFDKWIEFARERDLGIDFNPTFFSHEKAKGLTLSSENKEIRDFWIRHAKACRKIAEHFGKELKTPCLHNIWIPDGFKDIPADRFGPRRRLKESLDEIYSVKYDKSYVIDSLESKVFGIGLESFTVGSSEFYIAYAAKNYVNCLLDSGHYHPTEEASDKISALLPFFDYIALHITRNVRWDSDHVVLFDDATKDIAREIINSGAVDKILIGLDYFDASINRISAWTTGARSAQKALLYALTEPYQKLKEMQDKNNFTNLMAVREEIKLLPFGEVWREYLKRQNIPDGIECIEKIKEYEQNILNKRY